ncbi:unnamed protein product [Cochlearia groenlandica]
MEEGTNNNILTSSSFGLKQQQQQQHEAPPSSGNFHMDPPRSENPNLFPGGQTTTAAVSSAAENAGSVSAPPPSFSLTMPAENSSSELKKKRGRPRKYNPDGTLAVTLSPMPISSSVPLTTELASQKRGRGRGRGRGKGDHNNNNNNNSNNWLKNSHVSESYNSQGGGSAEVVSASLTPHVLTVNAGEDVTMKIMTFSQQDSRAICILSANGPISNVTLRQSMTSGGTLTYEGHFEILSLTGSFTPSESGGTRSRAGGMSVSLAGQDGRVFGGGLAGLFIAAGPVQVVVGSFIAGQEETKQHIEKQRRERLEIPRTTQASNISFGSPTEDPKARFGVNKHVVIQPPQPPQPVSAPPPHVSYSHEPNTSTVHGYYANSTANQIKDLFSSLPEDEDDLDGEDDEEFGGRSESDTDVRS